MERSHVMYCNLCMIQEQWSTAEAALAAVEWHVFDEHKPHWHHISGSNPPLEPFPHTLGTKLRELI
jgi:hypothetical protein